jgi:hypothetical protein
VLFNAVAVILLLAQAVPPLSRVPNLLINPSAEEDTSGWELTPRGATIEGCGTRNRCFTVRDRGQFIQVATLPPDSAGKFLLLVGFAQADRVELESGITDRPYLYGIIWSVENRALNYLQRGGPDLHTSSSPAEWQRLYSIYEVPPGAGRVMFQLGLAARKDIPQNGSAGRFDDVGMFLFGSADDARAFALKYQRQR